MAAQLPNYLAGGLSPLTGKLHLLIIFTELRRMDIDNEINTYRRMCGTIPKTLGKKVWKDTDLKFYIAIAAPILMYVGESWTLTQYESKRIQAAEMKFLRIVKELSLIHI